MEMMDEDETSAPREGRPVLVILVGAPGSGKSTFGEDVMRSSIRHWVRVCQAQKHVLVLARIGGLDCLADVQKEHLQLLNKMHGVGLKWAEKFLNENASLVFRLGYHSAPSMRQLHLHVISQDFESTQLKNKKHWNSFNTAFFRDSVDVMDEISSDGKATLKDDDKLLSMELRCHRCRSSHPNIPRLKSHISSCQSPFPAYLLQNGRLVNAPGEPRNSVP